MQPERNQEYDTEYRFTDFHVQRTVGPEPAGRTSASILTNLPQATPVPIICIILPRNYASSIWQTGLGDRDVPLPRGFRRQASKQKFDVFRGVLNEEGTAILSPGECRMCSRPDT